MVEYFFLTYVWLVLENVGFVQCYSDKSILLKILYYHLLKKHMDTRCYKKFCQFLKGDVSSLIIICICRYDTKDEMVIIFLF